MSTLLSVPKLLDTDVQHPIIRCESEAERKDETARADRSGDWEEQQQLCGTSGSKQRRQQYTQQAFQQVWSFAVRQKMCMWVLLKQQMGLHNNDADISGCKDRITCTLFLPCSLQTAP